MEVKSIVRMLQNLSNGYSQETLILKEVTSTLLSNEIRKNPN